MIRHGRNERRRGSIIVIVAFLVSTVAFLSLAMMLTVSSTSRGVRQARESIDAMYVCEAGFGEALFDMTNGGTGDVAQKAFGRASYRVDANKPATGLTSLTSTGSLGRTSVSVEMVVRASRASFFRWAAFGDEGLLMDSNSFVDSYDSSLGTYASQATNGSGSNVWANENGSVGSNQDITVDAQAGVHGNATPGPTGTPYIAPSPAFVTGSTAPSTSTTELPAVSVPVIPSAGSVTYSAPTTLPSGSYGFDTLTVDPTTTVEIIGPATVVITDFNLKTGAEIVVDATNGPVEFFVVHDFIIDSKTTIASKDFDPADVQINLLSDNIIDPKTNINLGEISFNSNSQVYGTIYAPNAAIEIDSNFELFGSLVARSVGLHSNANIHYDENLMRAAVRGVERYETVCWRILPLQ